MNEWLSEKSQDVVSTLPPPPPSGQPSKIEPLEVQVEEDTMYVACRPSPRNALDHLRRNSTSAGCSPYSNLSSSSKQESSSIGSAKKVSSINKFEDIILTKKKIEHKNSVAVSNSYSAL